MEVLQRLLQDKSNEVKLLQKKVSDVEHEKYTELVKLRLEVCYIHTYTHASTYCMHIRYILTHPDCTRSGVSSMCEGFCI